MEHPPKQGLKRYQIFDFLFLCGGFNGTSTKTRIETQFWNVRRTMQ